MKHINKNTKILVVFILIIGLLLFIPGNGKCNHDHKCNHCIHYYDMLAKVERLKEQAKRDSAELKKCYLVIDELNGVVSNE